MTVHLLWVHYMIGELFPKYQSGAKRMYVPINSNSLLCGPISPVVNLEKLSTARVFCGNAIYGCSGLGNCRMLKFLSIAICVIDLISMLIR